MRLVFVFTSPHSSHDTDWGLKVFSSENLHELDDFLLEDAAASFAEMWPNSIYFFATVESE